MSNERLTAVLQKLQARAAADEALDAPELEQRLAELTAAVAVGERDERLWAAAAAQVAHAWLRDRKAAEPKPLPLQAREQVVVLYSALGPLGVPRGPLLALLAKSADAASLAAFAELAAGDPPRAPRDALLAAAPLFQLADFDPAPLYPRLLDALAEPALAAAVLDLANYLFGRRRLKAHPAAARAQSLAGLLGQLVQRLGQAADASLTPEAAATRRAQVAESLGLAISLMHTARLLRDSVFTGKLYQALELPHRRLRVEAAAALAALGDTLGTKALQELAGEPVARGAALAYLEQFGGLEKVAPEWKSAAARAAGRLAVWLAEPNQYGLPPGELELLDERRQPWPGFEQPTDCFLFRYTYALPAGVLHGVGLAGPATWAFAVDPADVPVNDLYALFAGWQAEHDEISEQPLDERGLAAWNALQPLLESLGHENLEPEKLGEFFGERHLIVQGTRGGQPGAAVIDLGTVESNPEEAVAWYPRSMAGGALGATEAYWLHKGRLLLAAFDRSTSAMAKPR